MHIFLIKILTGYFNKCIIKQKADKKPRTEGNIMMKTMYYYAMRFYYYAVSL